MNLEETLQSLYNRSKIYTNRKETLNFIFSSVSHFKWVNGELVNYKEIGETFAGELDASGKSIEPATGKSMFDYTPIPFVPLDENSNLFSYPKDIKEDWLKGIEECKEWLKAQVNNVDESSLNNKDLRDWVQITKKCLEIK
ncbi:hypothetical protein [Priestia megaterium]|uniref:hypothetical protein n=1 Tax=Priestia megaterium TaxID=1404 RepID=UPI003101A3B1